MLKKRKIERGRSILFDLPVEHEKRFEAARKKNGMPRAAFARLLVIERLLDKTERRAEVAA